MATQQVLTDAGAAAFAAAVTGTAFEITTIEIGQARGYTPTATQTALMTPFSPVKSFEAKGVFRDAGTAVLNFLDMESGTYNFGEVAVKDENGTVIWILSEDSSTQWLGVKGQNDLLQTVHISIAGLATDNITFAAPPLIPPATTSTIGAVELATDAEALARTPGKIPDASQVLDAVQVASETVAGKVELSSTAENHDATSTSKAVTPKGVNDIIQDRVFGDRHENDGGSLTSNFSFTSGMILTPGRYHIRKDSRARFVGDPPPDGTYTSVYITSIVTYRTPTSAGRYFRVDTNDNTTYERWAQPGKVPFWSPWRLVPRS